MMSVYVYARGAVEVRSWYDQGTYDLGTVYCRYALVRSRYTRAVVVCFQCTSSTVRHFNFFSGGTVDKNMEVVMCKIS